jgi:hypothetical protein
MTPNDFNFFHEKAGERQVIFLFSCFLVFLFSFFSVSLLVFSRAASVAFLPSALFS